MPAPTLNCRSYESPALAEVQEETDGIFKPDEKKQEFAQNFVFFETVKAVRIQEAGNL